MVHIQQESQSTVNKCRVLLSFRAVTHPHVNWDIFGSTGEVLYRCLLRCYQDLSGNHTQVIQVTVQNLKHCNALLLQWALNKCTIIMVHKGMSSSYRSTASRFDLAWFSSLSFKRLCVYDLHGALYIIIFCLHPSLSLSVSWAWWIGPWRGWLTTALQCVTLLVGSSDP